MGMSMATSVTRFLVVADNVSTYRNSRMNSEGYRAMLSAQIQLTADSSGWTGFHSGGMAWRRTRSTGKSVTSSQSNSESFLIT